jgi:hypothetical protein
LIGVDVAVIGVDLEPVLDSVAATLGVRARALPLRFVKEAEDRHGRIAGGFEGG